MLTKYEPNLAQLYDVLSLQIHYHPSADYYTCIRIPFQFSGIIF